jgi:small subunit ribosomal protein S17e
MMVLGNVRSEKVKRIARELLERYPDKFTADFEENKRVISSLVRIPSTKFRNTIVGYITRLVALSREKQSEA